MSAAEHEIPWDHHIGSEPAVPLRDIATIKPFVEVGDLKLRECELFRGVATVGRKNIGWTLEVPYEPVTDTLSPFVPGFGGFKATSREPRRAVAAEGIPTFSYGPLRDCDSSAIQKLFSAQDAHVATLEAITDAITHDEDAMKTLRVLGINPLRQWVIMHSMGGDAGTKYAVSHPERISGITHCASIGFGSPTIEDLIKMLPLGIPGGIKHDLVPYIRSGHIDPTVRSLLQAFEYYLRSPLRTLGETRSCLTADLREDTTKLNDKGISTGYVGAEHDILVRARQENASQFEHFGIMPDVGHLFAQLKSTRMARQVGRHILRKGFDFTDIPK